MIATQKVGKMLDKKVIQPVKGTVRRFGRVMKSAVEWPGKQIEKEFKIQDAAGEKARKEGIKLNRQYSGLED